MKTMRFVLLALNITVISALGVYGGRTYIAYDHYLDGRESQTAMVESALRAGKLQDKDAALRLQATVVDKTTALTSALKQLLVVFLGVGLLCLFANTVYLVLAEYFGVG